MSLDEQRIKTAAGGHRLTDEVYNRRWFGRLEKRSATNDAGCFVWQGPVNWKGYANHAHRRWKTQAHRIVYMLTYGLELKTEQFVCHSCDNRRCWNPKHLWIGSNGDNQRDAALKGRHQETKKTHCPQGHEYTPANTYIKRQKGGRGLGRICLACQKSRMSSPAYKAKALERQRRNRQAKRLAVMEAN